MTTSTSCFDHFCFYLFAVNMSLLINVNFKLKSLLVFLSSCCFLSQLLSSYYFFMFHVTFLLNWSKTFHIRYMWCECCIQRHETWDFRARTWSGSRHGYSLKPPSYHEIQVSMLKLELEHTKKILNENEAEKTMSYECSLMADGSMEGQERKGANQFLSENSPRKYVRWTGWCI